jgi:(5-formylfuran-3-yl)methyl phosphate synthase
MTQLLASIQNLHEAETVFENGADIIDIGGEAVGMAGSVETGPLPEIINFIAGRRPVSVDASHLPMQPETLERKLGEFIAAGVEYIRIGLHPGETLAATIGAVRPFASRGKLVAVMFAEERGGYPGTFLDDAAKAGFYGVMIDTHNTLGERLLNHMTPDQIGQFFKLGQSKGLMTGAAGSLEAPDIPRLLSYRPDFLGFNAALRSDLHWMAPLDIAAAAKIRGLIPRGAARTAPVPTGGGHEAGLGTDKIFVRDFILPVQIGAYSFEHGRTQQMRFDVTADVVRVARTAEQLRHVVSYDLIMDGIRAIIARGHVELSETLAEQIAAFILENPRVMKVVVRAEKLELGPGGVGVEIERRRGETGGWGAFH